jgi:glycine cleavage system H protein
VIYPTDRQYTRDHEWVRIDAATGEALVGITDFAQGQLGDVVFVELPDVGRQLEKGQTFGQIESVKAVSELFSPLSGQVTAVNATLGNQPEQVNQAPHDTWMIRVRPVGAHDDLLDAAAYEALLK